MPLELERKCTLGEQKYNYLFPYEKVKPCSRILIYGAGTLGQEYLKQMQITHYCEVVGMADRNYKEYPPMIVPVYSPDSIHGLEFDYVVVALRMASGFNEIKRTLKAEGVGEEKIICIFERKEDISLFCEDDLQGKSIELPQKLAFQQSPYSFAILATGGIGDMVIQKRLIMELIRLVPKCRIDIYNIKTVAFLKYLYLDCPNVNAVIPDLGSRYLSAYTRYSLGMTIEACHFIRVDLFKNSEYREEYADFTNRLNKLMEEGEKENADICMPVHVTNLRRLYNGCNAYSGFNYNGAFEIKDKKVTIPLDSQAEEQFHLLKLGKYITVNYGNGDCKDGSKIAKMWPKEYFEQVITEFQKKYLEIEVVQIGVADAQKLSGADRYLLGEDFKVLAHILKNAILHLDIEGGLVHLASQLGTKCVVLFGPTVAEYYGYEGNINIRVGSCHNCWGLYTDVNKCVRRMKEPECMYGIRPEMVMKHICNYMERMLG